jgi:hypothetical protein
VRIARTLHDEFSLTREQVQALHDAFRAAHEALRTLHTDYAAGTITAEVVRDGAAAALQTLSGDLEATLGADAYARLTDLLDQARVTTAQRLLDTLDARIDRHFAFLTLVLGLDDAQQTAVRAALDVAEASTEALLIEVRDGGVTFPDALYRHLQIHQTLRAAVHAQLTQEQIDLLDALRPLMRHDPPWPLYF